MSFLKKAFIPTFEINYHRFVTITGTFLHHYLKYEKLQTGLNYVYVSELIKSVCKTIIFLRVTFL